MDLVQIKYGASLNGVYLEAAADMDPGETAMICWGDLERLVQRELARYAGEPERLENYQESPNTIRLKTRDGFLEVNCCGKNRVIKELLGLSQMARELAEQLSRTA